MSAKGGRVLAGDEDGDADWGSGGEAMPKRIKDRRRSLTPVSTDARTGADRRIHERVLVDIEVDYKADETFLFAYITDISAMGIFVRTNNPEPEGTRLNLCFRAPADLGGALVEVEGEVIWVNPFRPNEPTRQPGMGIQFVDLTPQQREIVMRMVRTFAYLDDDDGQTVGNS
jgi:type IV pilus assembly protein PilZ